MGGWRSIHHSFAFFNVLAFEYINMTPLRYQLFVVFPVLIGDNQTLFALGVFTKTDCAGLFGQYRRLFWFPGFKQIRNPGQTTGNITSFQRFLWQPGNHITHVDFTSIVDGNHGLGW